MHTTTPPLPQQNPTPNNNPQPKTSFFTILGRLWLYGTAFIGNCSCLAGLGIVMLFFLGTLGLVSAIADIESGSVGTSTSDKEYVIEDANTSDKILRIPIQGIITNSIETGGYVSSSEASAAIITHDLERALNDETIKAVILDVNTPGGEVVASDLIYQKILAVQESGKPVIALFTSIAASGGYYISAPADVIIANPDTLTGSIGVIMNLGNIQGLYDKIGYRSVVFKSGPYKDIGSGEREMLPEEQAIIQSLVDNAFHKFKDIVANGRNLSGERLALVTDGRIVDGRQAKELGLIDQLGYWQDAVSSAKDQAGITDAQIIEYEHGDFWDEIFRVAAEDITISILGVPKSTYSTPPKGLLYLWMEGI